MLGDIRDGAMYVSNFDVCAEGYPKHFEMGRGEPLTRSSECAVRILLEVKAHEHERKWFCRKKTNSQ